MIKKTIFRILHIGIFYAAAYFYDWKLASLMLVAMGISYIEGRMDESDDIWGDSDE